MLKTLFQLLGGILIFFKSSYATELPYICLDQLNGDVYSCLESTDDSQKTKCKTEFGKDHSAFIVDENCNYELALKLTGKDQSMSIDAPDLTPAVCVKFETGISQACEYWDYPPAHNYCYKFYGQEYLPHQIKGKCQIELADKEFGYDDPTELTKGLEPAIKNVEAVLTLIDREGLQEGFKGFVSYRPVKGVLFNGEILREVIKQMIELKNVLYHRSKLNIRMSSEHESTIQFLNYLVQYQSFVRRIYKLYAFEAHNQPVEGQIYDFKDLAFLELLLHRNFALELLAIHNFKMVSENQDEVRILLAESEKQIAEYMALSEPENKKTYAKLVSFLGIRENLTNIWGLNSYTKENLLNSYQRSCQDFLSISHNGLVSDFPTIKENNLYFNFYNEYLKNINLLVEEINRYEWPLEGFENKLVDHFYSEPEFNLLVSNFHFPKDINEEAIKLHFKKDVEILKEFINNDIQSYLGLNFKVLILPGDSSKTKNAKVKMILDSLLKRFEEGLFSGLIGTYKWLSNDAQEDLRRLGKTYFSSIRFNLEKELKEKIHHSLKLVESKKTNAEERKKQRVESIINALSPNIEMVHDGLALEGGDLSRVKPSTIEDLVFYFETRIGESYHDIKITLDRNKELARGLGKFFTKISQEFNQKYLLENDGKMILQGSKEERSEYLWSLLVQEARDIYLNHDFKLEGLSGIPDEVRILRNQKTLVRNPYTVPIYENGEVAGTLHINELYQSFQPDLGIEIPKRDIIMRTDYILNFRPLHELSPEASKISLSDYDRKMIGAKGEVVFTHHKTGISFESLKRLYLSSLDLSKDEIRQNLELKNKNKIEKLDYELEEYTDWWIVEKFKNLGKRLQGYSSQGIESANRREAKLKQEEELKQKELKTVKELYARVFELFHIPLTDLRAGIDIGGFALTKKEQKTLFKTQLVKMYKLDPLLRIEMPHPEKVKKWITPPYPHAEAMEVEVIEERERSLLKLIGLHAYSGELDKVKVEELVLNTLDRSINKVKGNIDVFCAANPSNFQNEFFRKSFRASKLLRENLQSEDGTTPVNAANIREFDKIVTEETRTDWQKFNEDYIEPGLMVIGLGTLVILGVVFSLATFGSGTPIVLTISAVLTKTVLISNYLMFALVVSTASNRINSHFILIPEQLKFQEKLVNSQILGEQLVSHEQIINEHKQNRLMSFVTVGLMPLDIWFGHSVVSQARKSIGLTAAKNFKKLTGLQLRNYREKVARYRYPVQIGELKETHGRFKAYYAYAKNHFKNQVLKLPKYQTIPEEFVGVHSLRIGLVNKLKELHLLENPSFMYKEVKNYFDTFKSRFTQFEKISESGGIEIKEKLKTGLTLGEVFSNGKEGIKSAATVYFLRSEINALRNGQFIQLNKNFGQLINQLREAQAELLKSKLEILESIVKKMEEFQMAIGQTVLGSSNENLLAHQFLNKFTEEELILIGEIAKKSSSEFNRLVSVFKSYAKVQEGIVILGHKVSHGLLSDYPTSPYEFMHLGGSENYKNFSNPVEDIVHYYEMMLLQHSVGGKLSERTRLSLESEMSKLFYYDEYGKKVFY